MDTVVIVISAHLKLESLLKYKDDVRDYERIIVFSSQYVFDNEREVVNNLHPNVEYVCFADVMSDSDGEYCDFEAFEKYRVSNRLELKMMDLYFQDLTNLKNQVLVKKIEEQYKPTRKYIASFDLGIDKTVWLANGYCPIECESYFNEQKSNKKPLVKRIFQKDIFWKIAKKISLNYPRETYVAFYNGTKILFHGHLSRAGYRMNLEFRKDAKESFKHWVIKCLYILFKIKIQRKNTINLTTLHEYGNYSYYEMMDIPEFNNYLFQDGYLPPNDTCKYLFFYGKHSKFLSWDKLGNKVFEYHGIPVEILPYRNIFPLPQPLFKTIKKVLCVSSGAGDWTAIKNRSDEDKTVAAFVEMAKRHPDIEFVYRCHPSWVSPYIQGVNSIKRLVDYFNWLNLPNIKVSSNIPAFFDKNGQVVVSHKRSSLETDLHEADFVFGVHSISMIDGAMQNIPFASVNLSGRRNLWKGITDLGFPHCETIEEIDQILINATSEDFAKKYSAAVANYNKIIKEL